ncbi:MAG: hypothetical protein ACOCXG_04840 [Nanoarchaeota archaeon]
MAQADWSIAVGVLVYFIAIIIAIILFLRYKKWSLVVYTASLATYTFAIFYTWDVFELEKNAVLIMLVVSTVLMMLVGRYFSKVKIAPAQTHSLQGKKKED